MKALAVILAVAFVAGCSGMQTSGSSGASGSGASSSGGNSSDYRYWQYNGSGVNRHDDPRDLYFGG